MNEIERLAQCLGYFDEHLSNYENLHKLFETYKKQNKPLKNEEFYFWSASGKLLYSIFENLFFIWDKNPNRPVKIANHLPTFIALYNLGYTVYEYLLTLVCLVICVDNFKITKDKFFEIINLQGKKRFEPIKKLIEANNETDFEIDEFKDKKKLRNYLNHAFRFLWWHNNKEVFGFKRQLSNEDEIKKEIWESLDEENYESEIEGMEDIYSGVSLINQLHDETASITNSFLKRIYDYINMKTNS